MAAMLIARFGGDVDRLKEAYDRAHKLIVSRGGATSFGELRHHVPSVMKPSISSVCGIPREASAPAGRARSSRRHSCQSGFLPRRKLR